MRPRTPADLINEVHRDLKALYESYVAELANKLKNEIRTIGIAQKHGHVEHYVKTEFKRLTADHELDRARGKKDKPCGSIPGERVVALQVKYFNALQLKNCFSEENPSLETKKQELKVFSTFLPKYGKKLLPHRTGQWKTNLATGFSFASIIPAAVRAIIYRYRYGSAYFWKSAGVNVVNTSNARLAPVLGLLPDLEMPSSRRVDVLASQRRLKYFYLNPNENWNQYFQKLDGNSSYFEADLELAKGTGDRSELIEFLRAIKQRIVNFELLNRALGNALVKVGGKIPSQLIEDQCKEHKIEIELRQRIARDFVVVNVESSNRTVRLPRYPVPKNHHDRATKSIPAEKPVVTPLEDTSNESLSCLQGSGYRGG